ncbi:MAG: GTP pyrophosphokinase family protein, partial [Clostridia bacterium]|nr:GTP pyrophosphokinase family protein [Clostridia bacterium]
MTSKGRQMLTTFHEYKELMMVYTCAMKEVQTKFDVLSTEFKVRYQRNPISSMSTRLKKTSAIAGKLSKRGLSFTLENIEEHIHDVAGVRVICSYIDDIYMIADSFLKQDDITLLEKKDYIAHPKENGYRSLHLIVTVPVFFLEQKRDVKVEVQIRT